MGCRAFRPTLRPTPFDGRERHPSLVVHAHVALTSPLRYNSFVALLGIFAGGLSRRMGGTPKGLLRAPGSSETLVARLARVGTEAGLRPILVGSLDHELGFALERIPDLEPGVGPLSGLAALLDHAGTEPCIAVACDMPFVSAALLSRLQLEVPDAAILAPRDEASGKWEPLCARYLPGLVRPALTRALASGARSFQAVFRELSVVELALSAAERRELRDWDTPEDITSA
jgi:molybdopterin-guanine dinucleotide biosynthesis protein A